MSEKAAMAGPAKAPVRRGELVVGIIAAFVSWFRSVVVHFTTPRCSRGEAHWQFFVRGCVMYVCCGSEVSPAGASVHERTGAHLHAWCAGAARGAESRRSGGGRLVVDARSSIASACHRLPCTVVVVAN